jgi:hypothetical protein
MKKQRLLSFSMFMFMALVVALVLPAPVFAGNKWRIDGDSADAYFSTVDATGCIDTDVYVFANRGKEQNPPGAPGFQSSANLWLSQYDTCTSTQLLGANGFTSLGDQDFQVDNGLNAATLNSTINVYDYISGATFDVAISLNWSATGPVSKGSWSSHYHSGKCITQYRSTGSWRPAQASGAVTVGATNYTPQASQGASLSTAKGGSLEIGCN